MQPADGGVGVPTCEQPLVDTAPPLLPDSAAPLSTLPPIGALSPEEVVAPALLGPAVLAGVVAGLTFAAA